MGKRETYKEKRKREKEKDFSSAVSMPKCPKWQQWAWQKLQAWNSLLGTGAQILRYSAKSALAGCYIGSGRGRTQPLFI